jgi:hypothetical protein
MSKGIRFLLAGLLFLRAAVPVFSRGEAEAAPAPLNGEWTLCITAFDISALSIGQRMMGEIVIRDLYNVLLKVDRRYRTAGEEAYYLDYAWSKSKAAAAKALAAKRGERDVLFYQGNPGWKYKKNIKATDAEIAKLEEELRKVEAGEPSVEGIPLFIFTEDNKKGIWPSPPKQGGEYRFCTAQKADAFLVGALSEYHGRVVLNLKMYTLYSRSWSWEDNIIFSSDDIQPAMEEISESLAEEVSGTMPGVLIVHAEPDNSMVIINDSYAGTGEASYSDHSPGETAVAIYADNQQPSIFPVELNPGEIAELYINLAPLSLSAFTVDVPGSPGSAVYSGSLYLGITPLAVEIPSNQFTYFSVIAPSGETGAAVYRGGGIIRGSAEFVRSDGGQTLVYETTLPISPEEKRVNTARRSFYTAYGRFWIALPVSLLAMGIAESYTNAYPYNPSSEMYQSATRAYNINIGAWVVIGLAAADTIYRAVRYLYTSRSDAVPLAQFPKNESPQEESIQGENIQEEYP